MQAKLRDMRAQSTGFLFVDHSYKDISSAGKSRNISFLD